MKYRLIKAFECPLGRFEEQEVLFEEVSNEYFLGDSTRSSIMTVGCREWSSKRGDYDTGAILNSEWFEKI